MEEVYIIFESVHKALEFFKTGNPARYKSINILEPSTGSKTVGAHFSGDHPHDVFSSVVHAIEYMYRIHSDRDMVTIFKLYHFTPEPFPRLSCKECAKIVGISPRRARSYLNKMESTLERELIRRQLIRSQPL